MKNRLVLLAFVSVILTFATLSLFKTSKFSERLENSSMASEEKLDSIINKKIDYRYTSYDNRFFYSNLVVVDSEDVIIGKLILYTNQKEIDSFYNPDLDRRKTKFFENLKNGSLRILPKVEK